MAKLNPLRIASGRDLLGLLQMVAGWSLTAVLPERFLHIAARLLASMHLKLIPGAARKGLRRTNRYAAPKPSEPDRLLLYTEHHGRTYEHLLGRVLDTHRRGWHPRIDLLGAEHANQGLDRGRGVIFWGMSFCGPVIPKAGLFRAGFQVTHLSTHYHGGFSKSWVAVHLLNPWTVSSENKYLAERIVIPRDGSLNYLVALKQHLLDNRCVSIMGEHTGIQNLEVPFLGGRRQFATGAPNLARSTGAALLTIFSYRVAPTHYKVVIEPPIEADFSRGRAEGIRSAIEQFARRLEHNVGLHPADWEGWSSPELKT